MNNSEKPKIGISACLIGKKVRYDGSHKHDHYLTDTLGRFVEWVPVCPEVEAGLPIPRRPMHLEGVPDSPRLITNKINEDLTSILKKWIALKLEELKEEGLSGFIFKSGSPSCGIREVRVYDPELKKTRVGRGIFALSFITEFPSIPIEDEKGLYDPPTRRHFIERVMAHRRWSHFKRGKRTVRDL